MGLALFFPYLFSYFTSLRSRFCLGTIRKSIKVLVQIRTGQLHDLSEYRRIQILIFLIHVLCKLAWGRAAITPLSFHSLRISGNFQDVAAAGVHVQSTAPLVPEFCTSSPQTSCVTLVYSTFPHTPSPAVRFCFGLGLAVVKTLYTSVSQ